YCCCCLLFFFFFFSSRRRHTRSTRDWSSDVCSSDLPRPSPWCSWLRRRWSSASTTASPGSTGSGADVFLAMLPLILASIAALFLVAPILIVVPMSFSTAISFQFPPPAYWIGYYQKFFTSEEGLEPALNSLIIAGGGMAF